MFRGEEVRSDNWVKKYHKYSEVCSSDCYIACDGRYKIEGTRIRRSSESMSASLFATRNI